MTPDGTDAGVSAHYGRADLGETILEALRAAGKDPDRLTIEDLAPVDQFHTRGMEATLELAELAELRGGDRVLDVGGGLGGPARTLAARFGCIVTVLDLTEAFCRGGEDLTRRSGLADRVTFRHGSALAMPFADGAFDVGWTQHSSMNIEDKERLYAEIHRVLRPGGRLVIHEVMAGAAGPVHMPVPWAEDERISFLRTPEEMRVLIAGAGFVERTWEDMSDTTAAWMRGLQTDGPPPPLGIQLILGPVTAEAFRNIRRNMEEGRIRVVRALFDRP
jgi:SAM-dependent methyltransferase